MKVMTKSDFICGAAFVTITPILVTVIIMLGWGTGDGYVKIWGLSISWFEILSFLVTYLGFTTMVWSLNKKRK